MSADIERIRLRGNIATLEKDLIESVVTKPLVARTFKAIDRRRLVLTTIVSFSQIASAC